MNILVTGGYGLIGTGIQNYIRRINSRDNYIFLSSKDCDLRSMEQTDRIFVEYAPDYVIHLAARVGGLYANMNYPVEFYRDNVLMNDVVMQLCKKYKVKKLISCLSTCIFPDRVTYPIDETMVHLSPPHPSNDASSYAKRMVDVMNHAYNREYGCNFTSIIPTNVYGSHDNFHLQNAHVIPSLIHKAYLANVNKTDFVVYGSGTPLRQFIFNEDLGELIVWSLFNYESIDPILLSVDEKDEVSIKDVALIIAECFNIPNDRIKFDTTKADGQYKKTASNAKLRSYLPIYEFKNLKEGIQETCEWFKNNYDIIRK